MKQIFLLFLAASLSSSEGQIVNSWKNPGSGRWDAGANWSQTTPPAANQTVMITNAGYKAVGIDNTTAGGTMTVQSLTVSSPPSALNNLLLNYPGTGTPLRIQNDLTLSTNGLLQNFYGSLQVDGASGGIFAINSAEFDQEGGLTVVTPMLRLSAAKVNVTNAVMNLGAVQIEADNNYNYSWFTQEGGTVLCTSLQIDGGGYLQRSGILYALGGSVVNNGTGQFYQSGGTNYGDVNVLQSSYEMDAGLLHGNNLLTGGGTFVNNGGTAEMQVLQVDGNTGWASYRQYAGALHCGSIRFLNSGAVYQTGGEIVISNGLTFTTGGTYMLLGGQLFTPSLVISNVGAYQQLWGTNTVSGDVTFYGGGLTLHGGVLKAHNLGLGAGTWADHIYSTNLISGVLSILGNYNFGSGSLEANGLYLRGSLIAGIYGQQPFLRLGGVLNMGGVLSLNTPNTVLGQVQLADNASIYLSTNGPIQRFADSSGLSWNGGSILTISGWSGSLSGGGATQIYFGNTSSGLTPSQLAQMRFLDPAGMPTGNYRAKILPTGEVVPTGPPPPVSGWGVSTYADTLQYPGTNRNIVALATRDGNSIAAGADGSAVAWGNASAFSNAPSMNNVMGVAAGSRFLMVLYSNGTVAAWGPNNPGPPSGPPGLANVVAIAAGNSYAIALKSDGTITGWGANDLGQLNVPANAMPAIAITAGQFHNLAIRPDNTVVAWGNNDSGQCNVPPGLSNVVAISAGGSFSVALRKDGTVAAWGGSGFYGTTNVPAGLSNVVAIAAGDFHVIALRSNGSIVGWGNYYYNGTGVPPWATNIVEIAAGSDYTLAVTAGGERLHGQISQTRWTPSASNPAARSFACSVPSRSGQVLRLEYVPSLSQTNWIGLPLFTGRAGSTTLYDNDPADPARFYRVRQW